MAAVEEAADTPGEGWLEVYGTRRGPGPSNLPPVEPLEGMVTFMTRFTAKVRKGRLVLDEPTDLPEGTTVGLVREDAIDFLGETDRRLLHEALSRSAQEEREGRVIDADEVLKRLRAKK